ncbi:MAG: polysaccharide pyruvyl transferase family protein [Nitrospirota bacterium]|jgi:hypothetical protein
MMARRALLTGHFSTVGDIECLEIVRHWLGGMGISCDVAPFAESVRAKLPGATDLARVDPRSYSHLVMICGPVWKEQLEGLQFDLARFRHCVRIGINLTLIAPIESWNPFDILLERDSNRITRPDLTLLADTKSVPVVVGRCLVRKQSSYAGRERHDQARQLFDDLIQRRDFAAIDLDTRWYRDGNGLRTPAHFLSALQRIDLLFTNRLHGMVYALKAGVPVVAIDAIEGGAKVSAQAEAIGWPQCIPIENATPERLDAAVDWCLSPQAQGVIESCRKGVLNELREVKREFLAAMATEMPLPAALKTSSHVSETAIGDAS